MRYLPICLLFVSSPVLAAKVGIGASAKGGDASIYVVMDVTPRFRIEPYFRYLQLNASTATTTDSMSANGDRFGFIGGLQLPAESEISGEALHLGTGVFALTRPTENTAIYYGARVSYLKRESASRSLLDDPFGFFPPTSFDIVEEEEGYSVVPSAGIEFYPIDRLSIAVEIGWEFAKTDGTISITDSPDTRTDVEISESRANLIWRYFF